MTNRREKIPSEAQDLAEKILRKCQQWPQTSPLLIFKKELELAMLKAYDAGRKIGERMASARRN